MSPLCICNGVIRSGSTWSFNVCREVYRELGLSRGLKSSSAYLDHQPLEQFVALQWPAMRDAATVIKAHSIGVNAMTAIRKGLVKGVCTYRDPRDCIASDLAFMDYPLEISIKRISGTLTPLRVYQTTPHILLVRYEDMMRDRLGQIRRIARHLGVQLDEMAVQRIDSKTNMESSQRICGELKHRPSDALMQVATHRVDPTTHLHENHVNGGTVGRWKSELSVDQAAYITEYFAPWLLQLGYETPASLQRILKTPAGNVDLKASMQQPVRFGALSVGLAGNRMVGH